MCDCETKTSDIAYDGSKMTCANNPELVFRTCEGLNDLLAKIFAGLCEPTLQTDYAATQVSYNTTASYPAAGAGGTITIPRDSNYYLSGNCTVTVPDGTTIAVALRSNAASLTAEKTLTNSSGGAISMDVSAFYRGALNNADQVSIGVRHTAGSAATVTQSHIYSQNVGG